jgi:hypothetical protein
MSLISNLEAINNCKKAIKEALIRKGGEHYMDDIEFSGYAAKIDELQLESGDSPSTPTPSADYIYSNGYMENEDGTPCTTPDITTYVQYEIPELNDGESYELELFGPLEFYGFTKGEDGSLFDYPDVVFGVDVPQNYTVDVNIWNGSRYVDYGVKENKYHKDIIRDGVKYNSFVKGKNSGYFYDANTVTDPSVKNKYKIIITK